MKKLKLFFVAMLLSAVAINSYAQSVGHTIKIDGVTYTYGGVTDGNRWVKITDVKGVTGVTGNVTFPDSIWDTKHTYQYVVREMVTCTFDDAVTSVTFSEGFQTLTCSGTYGGINGKNIKVINLPSTFTGYGFNGGSYNQTGISRDMPSLTDINVDPRNKSFCSVDGVLFDYNKTILYRYPNGRTAESYTVPEGVVSIFSNGIGVNNHLKSLTFASTTTTVGYGAPENPYTIACPNITELYIPAAMTSMPMLTQCKGLLNYHVEEGSSTYSDIDGVLCNADADKIISYPLGRKDESYQIPPSIKTIGKQAFLDANLITVDFEGSQVETIAEKAFARASNTNHLANVLNLPTTLRTIAKDAFRSNYYLTSIVLPEGLEVIGESAFQETNLTGEMIFPSTLKEIGLNAFKETKLTSVTIPASVTTLDAAFSIATLTAINVDADNEVYSSKDGVVFDKEQTTLIEYPRGKPDIEYSIPEGTVTIAKEAFAYTDNLTIVNIPASTKVLTQGCFMRCYKLKEVNIAEGSNLTEIEAGVFGYDYALKKFNLPASVTSIGNTAFQQVGLTSFTVPDNSALITFSNNCITHTAIVDISIGNNTRIETIGLSTALNQLKNVTIGVGNTKLKTLGGFNNAPNLETLTIAEDAGSGNIGITISENCFNGLNKLSSVTLPASVTKIDKMAFANCKNLKSVIIGDSEDYPCRLETIGENVFYNCGIETFTVPSSVKTIKYEAFWKCEALTTVDIPAGCTEVDKQAFEACPSLTAINVARANNTYSSSDGVFLSKNKETLIIYPAGKAEENFTLLPPSVKTIGEMSFYGNPNLKKVMIPKHVTKIDINAFHTCENLTDIVLLGDDPTSIELGKQAFYKVPADAKIWLRYDLQGSGITEWNGFTNFDYCKMGADDDTNHQYEFFPMADGSANVLSVKNNATDYSLVMPATVSDGTNEYNVDYLGDFMLEDAQANIKEVVVKHTPKYIGANAFGNADAFLCDDVDDMSTIRFDYYKSYFKGKYNEGKNLYMKKSVAEACLADDKWADLADVIEYHVPLPAIGTDYGTFSREFAIDLDAINPDKEKPNVIAFTAGNPHYDASKNLTTVTMVSINHTGSNLEGSSGDGDGTYIPANTGVLLKAYNGSSTAYDKTSEAEDKGAYYQIAENQTESYSGENLMANVTVHSRTIEPVEDGMRNFYVAQGKLWSFSAPRTSTVHKSYLQLPEEVSPNGAKLAIVFVDPDGNESTTGISAAELAEETDGSAVYNLQGQRVGKAVKGFYIKNGKKYLVK